MATCDGSADSSVHSLVRLRENCQLLQQTYFTFFQKIIRIQPGSSLLNPGCPISWAAAHINSVYLETSVPSWRHSMHMPCLTSSRSTVPLHHTATPCRISYRSVWLSIGSLTLDIKCDSRNTDRTYNRKVKAFGWKLCPGGSWDTFQSQRKAVGILGGSHTPGERGSLWKGNDLLLEVNWNLKCLAWSKIVTSVRLRIRSLCQCKRSDYISNRGLLFRMHVFILHRRVKACWSCPGLIQTLLKQSKLNALSKGWRKCWQVAECIVSTAWLKLWYLGPSRKKARLINVKEKSRDLAESRSRSLWRDTQFAGGKQKNSLSLRRKARQIFKHARCVESTTGQI